MNEQCSAVFSKKKRYFEFYLWLNVINAILFWMDTHKWMTRKFSEMESCQACGNWRQEDLDCGAALRNKIMEEARSLSICFVQLRHNNLGLMLSGDHHRLITWRQMWWSVQGTWRAAREWSSETGMASLWQLRWKDLDYAADPQLNYGLPWRQMSNVFGTLNLNRCPMFNGRSVKSPSFI
jgi:hypothetical protein